MDGGGEDIAMSVHIKKATSLIDCINSFELEPLRGIDYDNMFCDTHEARTGDQHTDPILELIDTYEVTQGPRHTLLVGHTGCGKSTEMQTFIRHMQKRNALVIDISAKEKLDLRAATYIDLLLMVMIYLVKAAVEDGLKIKEGAAKRLFHYWKSITERESLKETSIGGKLDFGVNVESSKIPFIKPLVEFFGNLGATLTTETVTRNAIKTIIEPEISEFIDILRDVSANISDALIKHNRPKIPIMVVDDLDKLEVSQAMELFYRHGSTLALLPFHVIYTFPIQMAYSPEFTSIQSYFEHVFLPMIKLRNWDLAAKYSRFEQGWRAVECIIEKRADESLFEAEALTHMIEMTGGYLRDLFKVIMQAAKRANRREVKQIEMEDAQAALNVLQSELARTIKEEHYETLKKIYLGNKQLIQNREQLLDLLHCRAVLEYNGKRWCDIHPLVEDLLHQNGVLN